MLTLLVQDNAVMLNGQGSLEDILSIYARVTNVCKEVLTKTYSENVACKMLHAAAELGMEADAPKHGITEVTPVDKED